MSKKTNCTAKMNCLLLQENGAEELFWNSTEFQMQNKSLLCGQRLWLLKFELDLANQSMYLTSNLISNLINQS